MYAIRSYYGINEIQNWQRQNDSSFFQIRTMANKKEQVAKTMIYSGIGDDESELIPIMADGDEQELTNS